MSACKGNPDRSGQLQRHTATCHMLCGTFYCSRTTTVCTGNTPRLQHSSAGQLLPLAAAERVPVTTSSSCCVGSTHLRTGPPTPASPDLRLSICFKTVSASTRKVCCSSGSPRPNRPLTASVCTGVGEEQCVGHIAQHNMAFVVYTDASMPCQHY